jgi:hypothetical protein
MVKFEIKGRKVSSDQFADAHTKAALEKAQDHIKKVVSSARCPEHGATAKVTFKGRSAGNLSYHVSGCCQQFIDSVTAKLK